MEKMKTPSRGNRFNCIFCQKTFQSFCNMDIHTRIHTNEKPFDCQRCTYSTTHLPNLKLHIRTHTGERPYKCHLCNKAFIQSSDLRRHLNIHTGEKPHKCEICGKCFALLLTLQEHIRTHTLEKPYKCEICRKRFSISSNLKVHRAAIHNIDRHHFVFKCVFCLKQVFRKQNYLRHIRSHISEGPHICRFCYREFVENCARKNHEMKLHVVKK